MRFSILLVGALALLPFTAFSAEVIRIGTLPALRYDISTFSVKPGAQVEVIFSNVDEMLHNFVITQPGRRLAVVEAAIALGDRAADRNFVPDSPDVLWATQVVPSGQSATLKFTAPAALGEYPYVCTFPGHGFVMFGTMIVTPTPQPPIKTVMPDSSVEAGAHHSMHQSEGPMVQRFFMPEAGPASIAVRLTGGYAYCWDAGACRFRYAWKGGYIEMPDRGTARIVGDIFYREPDYPVWIGFDPEKTPDRIQFHGYSLDAEGVPEFEYSLDGVKVRERISIQDGKLVRRFRTEAAVVWFSIPPEQARQITATTEKHGTFYKFTGNAAREFTITFNPLAN